jgi:signal transduction histidine kinase
VAYEVFTGKTLPRRGLLRFWRNAVMLSAGYGLLAAWSLTLQLRPIYSVLLTAVLLSAFYALISWRAYAEREDYMRQLRPFVAGQPLYQQLLEQAQAAPRPLVEAAPPAADPQTAAASASFQALCRGVLGARLAYLVPLGPTASLAGPALSYAQANDTLAAPADVSGLAAQVAGRTVSAFSVEPAQAGGATLALPLWSERRAATNSAGAEGLIGLLLLGAKTDGGLYTQEEIDIARAGGERLIDALASAELARRLLVLQRQRLAESQVVDQRTRRVLHDDVLPQLHAALLHLHALSDEAPRAGTQQAATLLAGAHRQIAELLRELPAGPLPDVARLGLIDALRKSVAGEFARSFDGVDWRLTPEAESAARALPDLTAEVLFNAAREALRNAARHARRDANGPLHVQLSVTQPRPGSLALTIEDDGAGWEAGNGAAATSGTGQGLALHATLLAVVGGTLTVESEPGAYTRVRLLI